MTAREEPGERLPDEALERIYGHELPGGVRAERCDAETYWRRHEEELREHFPPEAYFRLDPEGEPPVDHCFLLLAGDRLAGVTSGTPSRATPSTYLTSHTTIHPDFRRLGIYAELQRRVLAYSREAGFRRVDSSHAPSNNAVLIAKLRAGFRIVTLDLDPAHGPVLVLRYFHEPVELAAYEYRCGHASVTPELARTGFGAWDELRRQLRASS